MQKTIANNKIKTTIIEQVNNAKKEFITDGYTMSIGEIINLYKDGELIIDLDFQRAFRWSIVQQTKLIESILIGVPLPSIFVYQNKDGAWEVVDGVQRLSTILQFVGVLANKDSSKDEDVKPTVLEKTKNLPCLENMTWKELPIELQLDFKRTRIEVKIIKYLSDKNAKFDVFQRLNWSSILSGQEYRNALIVMMNKVFFDWMVALAKYPAYQACINLTGKWLDEKYDQELILRLFTFSLFTFKKGKVDDFINDSIFYEAFNLATEKQKFHKTFDLLLKAKGESVFQKQGEGQQFLESYFEAIAIGLYNNIDNYSINANDIAIITNKIDNIEAQTTFNAYKRTSGTNAETRIRHVVPFGKEYFTK
jgi:Protein of unknown function DUF262